jgi:hypothetical protein
MKPDTPKATKCYRCNLPATKRVGIADPDMTQYPYCDHHAKVMQSFIILSGFPEMFKQGEKRLMELAEAMAHRETLPNNNATPNKEAPDENV